MIEASISPVVCDAGPLIHLDELGVLDLLADFNTVLVPNAVWQEVERHRPTALAQPDIPLRLIHGPFDVATALRALTRVLNLHAGEREALSLAAGKDASLFFSDDTAARMAAAHLSIQSRGTIGILVRAIRKGYRTKSQVLDILRSIPARSTLHIRRSLLESIIAEVQGSD